MRTESFNISYTLLRKRRSASINYVINSNLLNKTEG